jgi:hypothetical protein
MKDFFLDRLKEPSTWRGIIWCVSAFGLYHFSNDQEAAITALAMALAGGGGLLPDSLRRLPERKE